MVKINRIYTKTGDRGDTGLVGGSRVGKDSERVGSYGDLDELNAWLGVARTALEGATDAAGSAMRESLARIQNELFDIGAELASPPDAGREIPESIDRAQIERLEGEIDGFVDGLPELRSFVLPGGTRLNAELHVARTVCRRAERSCVSLSRTERVRSDIVAYLNRLSDLLFAMARAESFRSGSAEYLWVPRGSQSK